MTFVTVFDQLRSDTGFKEGNVGGRGMRILNVGNRVRGKTRKDGEQTKGKEVSGHPLIMSKFAR